MGDIKELIVSVASKVSEAERFLEDIKNKEMSAMWDSQYMSSLPNAAFAVVESGYKEGDNKNARHLP
jgi:hypothetical protein